MRNGAGTPYIHITDFEGNIITELVTQFRYVFSEKTDDFTLIVFEFTDPLFPDKPGLQENRPLTVKWGYRENPSVYNTRTIYIRECLPDYNETGMTLDLKCTDKASYLKQNNQKKTYNGSPLDITQQIADENGLTIDAHLETSDQDDNVDKLGSNVLEGYPQAGTSDFSMLQGMWDEQENGPYTVEGRDDKLIIRRKNYSKKSFKTFVYGKDPHQLLRFTPETKNRMHGKGAKQGTFTYMDPATKTIKTFVANALNDPTTKLGEIDEMPKSFFVNKVRQYISEEEKPNGIIDPEQKAIVGFDTGPNLLAQRDHTSIIPALKFGDIRTEGMGEVNSSPGWNELSAISKAIADRQNSTNETNPGTATILGDPTVECSIILTFLGIAKKYSGNYYILRAEHLISRDNGFTVELSFVRNARRKTGSESPGYTNTESFNPYNINKVEGGYTVKVKKKTLFISQDDISKQTKEDEAWETTPNDPTAARLKAWRKNNPSKYNDDNYINTKGAKAHPLAE